MNLRVTEILGCKLKLWFKHIGQVIPSDKNNHPTAEKGKEVHKAIENLLLYNKLAKETDFKYADYSIFENFLLINPYTQKTNIILCEALLTEIRNTDNIIGHPDLVITDNEQKEIILYDWKTGIFPRVEHLIQTNKYADMINKQTEYKINKIIITYLGGDYPVLHVTKPNFNRLKQFEKEYILALEILQLLEPPIVTQIEKADYECLFCEYFKDCKEHYYSRFIAHPTDFL